MKREVDKDGKTVIYIHQSDLGTARMCAEQLRLSMTGELFEPDGDSAMVGTLTHEFIEFCLHHCKDTGEWPESEDMYDKLQEVKQKLADCWDELWLRPKASGGVRSLEHGQDGIQRCCVMWAREVMPTIDTTNHTKWEIELPFSTTIRNDERARIVLRGHVDFWDGEKARDWKGLPLDTPIPTLDGFTPMGELVVGETVFDMLGDRCVVTAVSETHHNPCYEILLDDGETVVADHEHRWVLTSGECPMTEQLKPGDRIPTQGPANRPSVELPIEPWLFGFWLGNGRKSESTMSVGSWKGESDLGCFLNQTKGMPKSVSEHKRGSNNVCIYGMRTELRKMGQLVKDGEPTTKHIPENYLTASTVQRERLLMGLLDSDGQANDVRKEVVFSTTTDRLADDVSELLWSLGIRHTRWCGDDNETRLRFTTDSAPFTFERKRRKFRAPSKSKAGQRTVVSVTPVAQVPTRCITVDSPSKTYLATHHYLPTHNTSEFRVNENWIKHRYDVQSMVYTYGLAVALGLSSPVDFELVSVPRKPAGKTREGVEKYDGPVTVELPRNSGHWEMMKREALSVADLALNTPEGVSWPLGPKDWHCSERWCSHHARGLCVGKLNPIYPEEAVYLTRLIDAGVEPKRHDSSFDQ